MALKLDNALLDELGLGGLPDSEKQLLLRQIYEKLEMNVGMRLADQMSNEQLDAFEKFVDANDDKGAFQWLETNFPNYKQVVNEEFEKLKAEIRMVAPQILATAGQNAAAGHAGVGPAGQGAGQAGGSGAGAVTTPQAPFGQPGLQGQGQPVQAPPYGAGPMEPPMTPGGQQPYPPGAAAVPQNGHLQPQYGSFGSIPGAPTQVPQPDPYQQPGVAGGYPPAGPAPAQPPHYPPQAQPPAGTSQ